LLNTVLFNPPNMRQLIRTHRLSLTHFTLKAPPYSQCSFTFYIQPSPTPLAVRKFAFFTDTVHRNDLNSPESKMRKMAVAPPEGGILFLFFCFFILFSRTAHHRRRRSRREAGSPRQRRPS
jgi:hypothetical protein